MASYLRTFFAEKDIDREEYFTVEGPSGGNIMPYGAVIDAILAAPRQEQTAVGNVIRRLDFANADIKGYLRHLAQAIAR